VTTLSEQEFKALCKWAQVDLSKSLGADDNPNPFNVAGSIRNVLRRAESFGPSLVALLASRGFLELDRDPVEALENILNRYEDSAIDD
jgi:hypothetical protein